MTPILLSNEDLKELYEKKKELKNRKEVHHFQDAHDGKYLYIIPLISLI